MIGTTTIAAPATYGAYGGAYGGVSTYAAPATTAYAAPMATTAYAAPATTAYAQPATYATTQVVQPTTQVASYVAQPQAYAAPVQTTAYAAPVATTAAPQMAMPAAPPSLTQGIPTPDQIAAQKAQYAAALDKQLEQAKNTVINETKIEQQMAKFNADKNISLFQTQIEERRVEAEAQVEEMATIQALELKKALVERNLQLDNQASGLTMDYRMKECVTQHAMKAYQFQQQFVTAENKLAQDYNAQVAKANTGTAYAPTAQAVRK